MSEQTPSYVTASAQRPEQLEVLGYVQDTSIPNGDNDTRHLSQVGAYLAQSKESHTYFWIDAFVYQDRQNKDLWQAINKEHRASTWYVSDHGVYPVRLPVDYGWQNAPRKQDGVTDDDIVMWYAARLAEECEKLRQRVIRWEDR